VVSNPAGGTDSNAGSTGLSHIVTGLTNGTAYTFTVTATNSVGTGPASLASNSVTPAVLLTPQTIGTISFAPPTLQAGGTTTASALASSGLAITFSSLTSGVCTVSGAIVTGVSVGICSITANQSGNATYSAAAQTTQTITINKATPTVIWAAPASISYGTALSGTQLNATASIPGTFVYTPGSGTIPAVGTQTLSVSFMPTDAINYNSQTATVAVTVTDKITPVISWSTPAALTFGAPLDATQLNASSVTPGTFTYTPPVGTLLAAGSHTLSVTFTPTDPVTYSSTSATVSLVINKAPALVLLWAINQPQTYDSTPKAVTLTTEPPGLAVDVTYNGTVVAPSAAGSYGVVATVLDANYIGSATGTMIIAKATPVISWANPADISSATALSATQLNATSGGVPGTFVYSPASGTLLSAGVDQILSVTFTPIDTANYSGVTKTVAINVIAASANLVTTGLDGITTAPATINAGSSTITIPVDTQLLDGNGNPISGSLTVTATVLPGAAQLPAGLATAQTADGKSLAQFGNSIDITISAGAALVKKITPAMIVSLPVPLTFAMDGTTVSYYSYDGTHWNQEGTAVVTSGQIAMQVSHLSVWAVAAFAVDTVPPTVATVDMPTTTTAMTVPVTTIAATDNVAVAGYLLTESPLPPPATAPGWLPAVPPDYQCRTWGNNVIYTYAKDTAGNVSQPTTKVIFVGLDPVTDGVIVPAVQTAPVKLEPHLTDALKSLNFAMKIETPSAAELQHGKVAPLVGGIPQPDSSRTELNLGDTIVILRRVVGL
jgi:hypothetical protein